MLLYRELRLEPTDVLFLSQQVRFSIRFSLPTVEGLTNFKLVYNMGAGQ